MNISHLMSRRVISVDMDDPVSKVKQLFSEKGFHHLLVTENKRLTGVISDRDLLKAISPKVDTPAANNSDLATLNKRVHQIMSHKPITLTPDASVQMAVHCFNEHAISCIPIINANQHPVGILSWRDIMRALEQIATRKS